jgi:hypothetical protein
MAAVRGLFQTGMAMKPSKTFFLSKFHYALASFISTLSNSRFWRISVRGQMSRGDLTRDCHEIFPKHLSLIKIQLPTFGLAGTRLRDETIRNQRDQTLVGIGKANVRHKKKVLDNFTRAK